MVGVRGRGRPAHYCCFGGVRGQRGIVPPSLPPNPRTLLAHPAYLLPRAALIMRSQLLPPPATRLPTEACLGVWTRISWH